MGSKLWTSPPTAEARPAQAQPEQMPLSILFEDADLLVLNKPAGLVVHPAAGHPEHTLVNALLHHCAGNLSGIGGVARPGIVHRLDRETSGKKDAKGTATLDFRAVSFQIIEAAAGNAAVDRRAGMPLAENVPTAGNAADAGADGIYPVAENAEPAARAAVG